ncbi:FecR family protein [Acidovorax sp. Root217]|uniref:FecR family protein n=1 Tax=unclassified Acidovorax TaxID=2684926 RepID=UPI00070FBE12|nr:FecR family protein [Acidovorax sp. Root217]KRC21940.1 iron dicitrate transport regulator FecR [Acidovorax sp. Root217]
MSATPPALHAPTHEAMEQAATWFSLLQSGTATDADHARWQAWLASGGESQAAWAVVERVSQRFSPLQSVPSPRLAADALQSANQRLAKRRSLVLGVAAMAGSGVFGWALWQHAGTAGPLVAWGADHRTATGERRKLTLADGTQVWLASASAIDEDYRADLRRLRLRSGEVLVQTAPDRARPFVVDTAHGRMQALGTRFNVRLDGDGATQLAVYEGAVQVTLAGTSTSASHVIQAGHQVRFTAHQMQTQTPADPAREAWSRGILLAQDLPLSRVVQELGRYRRGHIAVAPDVAHLTVLGSYPLDDFEGTLDMLQQALPIQVRQPLPWWTTIEARTR